MTRRVHVYRPIGVSVDTSADTPPIYRRILDRVSTDISVEAPHKIHDAAFLLDVSRRRNGLSLNNDSVFWNYSRKVLSSFQSMFPQIEGNSFRYRNM